VEELQEMRMGAVFFPHGLGHLLGLSVHDVGGYNKSTCPPRLNLDGLNRLRTRRVLKENMILTVEPGCYFIELLIRNIGICWTKSERKKEPSTSTGVFVISTNTLEESELKTICRFLSMELLI
jgi:hypothetical protein